MHYKDTYGGDRYAADDGRACKGTWWAGSFLKPRAHTELAKCRSKSTKQPFAVQMCTSIIGTLGASNISIRQW